MAESQRQKKCTVASLVITYEMVEIEFVFWYSFDKAGRIRFRPLYGKVLAAWDWKIQVLIEIHSKTKTKEKRTQADRIDGVTKKLYGMKSEQKRIPEEKRKVVRNILHCTPFCCHRTAAFNTGRSTSIWWIVCDDRLPLS